MKSFVKRFYFCRQGTIFNARAQPCSPQQSLVQGNSILFPELRFPPTPHSTVPSVLHIHRVRVLLNLLLLNPIAPLPAVPFSAGRPLVQTLPNAYQSSATIPSSQSRAVPRSPAHFPLPAHFRFALSWEPLPLPTLQWWFLPRMFPPYRRFNH